ncbi:hypothetical protein ES319_D11G325300v1 [Gossypium barbadense]|uniref:Uncharacterized protein n=3 Tax=Gossypium TaxID=3633 RepID=A0A5J5PLS9_GOSBA|nr:hypothetical protein ES319_D11G325300v1 [Gossypium barbadense]TYG47503.1 hypothetical protein ES288_D11G344400v1 [Gossypium darwinii]TYH46605.1 hypothetical protein ES332_D11G349300v1 [Gossypium tomentosum]
MTFCFLVNLESGFLIPKNIRISPFYLWNLFQSDLISLHLPKGIVFFSLNSSFSNLV